MIIDAHSHIEPLEEFRNQPGSSYGMPVANLKTYLADYDANGVDACFTFGNKALWLESLMIANNDALAKIRDQAPKRILPWGLVHPAWPEKKLRVEIRRVVKNLGFYGLKFLPIVQGYPISAVGMDIVAEEAIDLDIPVVFHDGSPEYCSAIQVAYYARKYPKLRVLSGHGGLRELWPDFIDAVRELPNLWICLSGPTQLGIQSLYDQLGPDKLLFGSDGGLGHKAVTTAYLRRIDRLNAPQEHKEMILATNALKLIKKTGDFLK